LPNSAFSCGSGAGRGAGVADGFDDAEPQLLCVRAVPCAVVDPQVNELALAGHDRGDQLVDRARGVPGDREPRVQLTGLLAASAADRGVVRS
jgi:hypothetical protein